MASGADETDVPDSGAPECLRSLIDVSLLHT
jgi:hypothetical protein